MKIKSFPFAICIIAMLFLTSGGSAAPAATPLGTAFTYQGRLVRDGQPFTGTCDFLFSLFDAETAGTEIGDTVALTGLAVTGGLFTARLDFNSGAFAGETRWLELSVQCPGDVGYTIFPRQELTAAPYALYAAAAPWNGITGKPAGLDDGDNDTIYSAGNGLSLTTTTFAINPAYTQRRVFDGCKVGSTIRAINEDGSVECQSDAPGRPPYTMTTLGINNQGNNNSITIGIDGLGLIAFFDASSSNLNVAHCDDTTCNSATITPIDESDENVGASPSIIIGADGLGLISYYDQTNDDLKVAHCENVECTGATTYTVAADGDVGMHNSIAIGVDGLGLISFYDYTNKDLKVAHCSNILCSSSTPYTLATTGDVGSYNSITVGADGLGLIAYFELPSANLIVAHCTDIPCSSVTTSTIDSTGSVGLFSSTTIGNDGLALISYWDLSNSDLKIAHCDNITCSSASYATLDSLGQVGTNTSITIGADGLGLISYFDMTNSNLKVAHCNGLLCTSATTYTLDSVGSYTAISITTGADGLGLISYYDQTDTHLKVIHCGNNLCLPYVRRR